MIKEQCGLTHTLLTPLLNLVRKTSFLVMLLVMWIPIASSAQTILIDSLWQEYHESESVNSRALVLARLGYALRTVNTDSAFAVLDQGLKLSRETGYIFGEAECILNTGSVYLVQSDFDKAQESYQKALGLYESIDSVRGVAKSMNNLGLIYFQEGDYKKANTYYKQSLNHYDELHDQGRMAASLHNIAMVSAALGNYPEALESYLKSLKIVEGIGSKQGIAYTCIALGGLYQTIEDFDQAITYYERGLKLSEEIRDNIGIITCLFNIGTYNEHHKEYYTALDYYQRSLALAQKISNEQYASIGLRAIGNVYKELERYPESEDFFQKALEMQQYMGDEPGMSETYLLFGELYTEMGKEWRGINYIKEAIAIAKNYGNQEDLLIATESLADVYEKSGRLDKALDYYIAGQELRDSILGMGTSAEIARIQLKYNSEIQEKDFQLSLIEKDKVYEELKYKNQRRTLRAVAIALFIIVSLSLSLWYLNKGRKKANIALTENNEALDKATQNLEFTNVELLKANHQLNVANASLQQFAYAASNDLMESLGAVSKYSQLLRSGMETDQPDEMINYYLDIIARNGRQMYKTLDDLLNYVNLRVNPSAKLDVDLRETVELIERNLEQEIEPSGGQLIYQDLPCLQAQPHLIRQLFYQLIKNAIQFRSHDEIMLIEIGIDQSSEKDFVFYIKDNGIGICPEFHETIFEPFSRVAAEDRVGSGLGLALCKKIVELYRGKIWIESQRGFGTSVYFTLPDCEPTFDRKNEHRLAMTDN